MALNTLKKGTPVISSYNHQTGKISHNYDVLGLHKNQLTIWKKNFYLIEWNDGKISGELKWCISPITI